MLQMEYVVVGSRKSKVSIANGVILRKSVTDCLGGRPNFVSVGIDPGLNQLTVCLIALSKGKPSRQVVGYTFETGKSGDGWRDRYDRIMSLVFGLGTLMGAIKEMASWVFLEGYATKAQGRSVQTMAEIRQSILQVVVSKSNKVVIIAPVTWKAIVNPGLGRAGMKDKAVIMNHLRKERGIGTAFGEDHNLYDAYSMAKVGEMIWSGKDGPPALMRLRERENLL